VTTFTTTGFGYVIPTSQSARALVTGQMAAGFLLIKFAFGIA
jgi:Ion channel